MFFLIPVGTDLATIETYSKYVLYADFLGVDRIIIGINMVNDKDDVDCQKDRYDEIKNQVIKFLNDKSIDCKSIVFIPYTNWIGDNIIKKSTSMAWWNGCDLVMKSEKDKIIHVDTLAQCLDLTVEIPKKNIDAKLRISISGVFRIKNTDIICGLVEQGILKKNDEVYFLPNHTNKDPSTGKIFSIEMNHRTISVALPGDHIGMTIKALDPNLMPKIGNIMLLKNDTSINICKKFTIRAHVLNNQSRSELKVGLMTTGSIRSLKTPIKLVEIKWKITSNKKKILNPLFIEQNDIAELVFEPREPCVVQLGGECDGLSRIAIWEDKMLVMIGKIIEYN